MAPPTPPTPHPAASTPAPRPPSPARPQTLRSLFNGPVQPRADGGLRLQLLGYVPHQSNMDDRSIFDQPSAGVDAVLKCYRPEHAPGHFWGEIVAINATASTISVTRIPGTAPAMDFHEVLAEQEASSPSDRTAPVTIAFGLTRWGRDVAHPDGTTFNYEAPCVICGDLGEAGEDCYRCLVLGGGSGYHQLAPTHDPPRFSGHRSS